MRVLNTDFKEYRSLNVLIIAQYFLPDMGGASARAFNVAKGLIGLGCSVNVITAFPHYPKGDVPKYYKGKSFVFESIEDIQVLRVWIPSLPHNNVTNRIILHLSFLFSSLFPLFLKREFDVIWAANPNLFSFLSALIYSFFYRKPIVRNVDDLWPEVFYDLGLIRSKLFKIILDFIAKLSYVIPLAITPISSAYKREIIKKYHIEPEKLLVIEVGIDIDEKKELEITPSFTNDHYIVMYSGILGISYDFDNVLKAAKLLEKYNNIIFMIRGLGECENEIRKMINKYNLKNVVLKTEYLQKSVLQNILSSADVFILPMKKMKASEQGLPTKLFEYQSYSKPIICISEGEPAEYIKKTKSGLVTKTHDEKALSQAILTLYRNIDLAKELGSNGFNYVSKNLTPEKIGQKMLHIFHSVTSQVK